MTSATSCLGFDEPLRFWLWQGISSRSPGTLSPRALKEFRKIKLYDDLEIASSGVCTICKNTDYPENIQAFLPLTYYTFTKGANKKC